MMYKYAINPSKELTLCDCETMWNCDLGWTEEMYTGEVYQCQIVECPYTDALLSDFDVTESRVITFNEESYIQRVGTSKLESLRTKRKGLLSAFDRYKSNVLIGIEQDISMSTEVLEWYQDILDLNEEAIDNPPERIKYYMY